MAHGGGGTKTTLDDLESVTCSICLDIYCKPLKIQCGHSFCSSCLSGCMLESNPHCPMCRSGFSPSLVKPNAHIEKLLSSHKGHCKWCSKKTTLVKLRIHTQSCSKQDKHLPQFKPVAETSQPMPSFGPNRSTFQCPYCHLDHLDCIALVSHCNKEHKHSPRNVVCPVCSSMPWGDASRVSSDFIQHLNNRHKFEYDTYVDYAQDEDAMLQAAVSASLEDS